MVEEFSAGYFLLRLYVEPYAGDRAVLNRADHAELRSERYPTNRRDSAKELPLLVKVDEAHIPVLPGDGVPTGTLALPDPVLEETRIDAPPSLRDILLAKAEQTARLFDLFDPSIPTWTPS
jgi:hypothetical protein